jgi:hypothetical protein
MTGTVTKGTLRLGEVGPEISGNAGEFLAFGADGRTLQGTPAPGGGGAPLTRDFYCDPGRTTSTEDGSIGQPFKTAAAGIAAIAALPPGARGALLLADSDAYQAEDIVITSRMSLRAIGEGRGSALFNSITIGNGASLVQVSNVAALTTTVENADLEAFDCETLGVCTLNSSGGGSGVLRLFRSNASIVNMTDPNQGVLVERGQVNGGVVGAGGNPALGGSVVLKQALLLANVDATFLDAFASSFAIANVANDATIVESAAAQLLVTGALRVDAFTLSSVRLAAFGANTFGSLVILDRPLSTGLVFAVGALAGAFADVTAALPGCMPGDTFDVTTTSRLADVGIVDAFCDLADVLTLRFFGTTAGGNVTCTVNMNPNS